MTFRDNDCYLDAEGARHWIGSGDINRYLQELGGDRLTAKTFRTWLASVSALVELRAQLEQLDSVRVAA